MLKDRQEQILRPIAGSEKFQGLGWESNSRSPDLISGVMATTLPRLECFTRWNHWVLASISDISGRKVDVRRADQ